MSEPSLTAVDQCADCGKEIHFDPESGLCYDVSTDDQGHETHTYYCRAEPTEGGVPNIYTMQVDYHYMPGTTRPALAPASAVTGNGGS